MTTIASSDEAMQGPVTRLQGAFRCRKLLSHILDGRLEPTLLCLGMLHAFRSSFKFLNMLLQLADLHS